MIKNFRSLLTALTVSTLISCHQGTTEAGLSQGIIEYEITYPETGEIVPYKDFLPKSMLFKFKDNNIAFEMSGPMNLVKTSFISDLETKNVLHLIKVMDKKLATSYSGKEVEGIDDYHNLKINHSDETKVIAGYDCQKATITFVDDENTSFEIFYTNQLKLKSPNWSTPYNMIDGVLMQYRLKRYNLTMEFTAKKVMKAELTKQDFTKPADYKVINKEEARNYLNQSY